MYLTKLYVQDFRIFTQNTWDFDPGVNWLVAPNGSGKSSILEAISLLSTTKSWRADKTAEMIRFDQQLARVYALRDDGLRLGITLTPGVLDGRKTSVKHYQLDQARKRAADFLGHLYTVCFRPEDLNLITGSSSRRRTYLDTVLLQTSSPFALAHKNYAAANLRRTKTLQDIRDQNLPPESLNFWDEQVLMHGQIIQEYRQKLIDFINEDSLDHKYQLVYQPNLITSERLADHRAAELALGHPLVGPHKDDWHILTTLNHRPQTDLANFGSRGQQRLAVLFLLLAQLHYLHRTSGHTPLLLLDDIFSELDELASQQVLSLLPQQQTFVTTTAQNMVQLDTCQKIITL